MVDIDAAHRKDRTVGKKYHFKHKDGEWYAYHNRSTCSWAPPITKAVSLNHCIDRLTRHVNPEIWRKGGL